MNTLQLNLIVEVFNSAINQLKITNKGRYSPSKMEVRDPCEERFQSKMHESVFKQLDPFRPSQEAMNELEVEEETNSLITLYKEIMDEIKEKGTFNGLLEVTQAQIDEAADVNGLMNNFNEIHKQYEDIRYKLRHHDSKSKVEIHNRDDTLALLKAETENIQVINKIELNLVEKWEKARFDQGTVYAKNIEKELLDELREYDWKIHQEENAIKSIEKFYDEQIEDLRKTLKNWTENYEIEITIHENEIKELKYSIYQIKKDHEEHLKTYEKQKCFIDEYKALKAIEELAVRAEEKKIESTIVIQSWWRGTMVRQNLGLFKSKKKKGRREKKGK